MLLSAFNEYLEYDTVRERLLDAEASLKLHVQLAAELAGREGAALPALAADDVAAASPPVEVVLALHDLLVS